MVQFNHVTKLYDNKIVAVEDISFTIEEGEFIFLIGPSGSGKTTVIKMLIRDETPSTGQVYFGDKDITRINRSKVYKLRREIGVIFQDYKLIPDKTAFENVAFALEAAGKTNKEIKETVPYVLDIVGLSHRMGAFPRQLSGGEQQRVAIARAIANNPKILIADEPTGNLDPASAWDIVQILSKINNWGTTVIMSTHGTDIVNSLNKRVIQMHGGKVMRDDNKGQYEMTNFEAQMVNNAEKKHSDKPKEKKKYKITLPKDEGIRGVLGDSNINVKEIDNVKFEKVDEPSLLNKLFSKFSFKKRGDHLIEYESDFIEETDSDKEQEASDKSKQQANKLISEPASTNIEIEVAEVDTKKLFTKEVELKLPEDKPKKKGKKTVSDLTKEAKTESKEMERPLQVEHSDNEELEKEIGDRKQETAENEEVEIKNEKLKEPANAAKMHLSLGKGEEVTNDKEEVAAIQTDSKTPIRKLNLPKQILGDLKIAGYKYVEEIINDGPEGLSKKLSIDPEEVVIIAEEIKKFAGK
jgi:cell division transport system ATP-binding protein